MLDRRTALSLIGATSVVALTAPGTAMARAAAAALPPADMGALANRVVVLKSERKLVLMNGERALKAYRVALGRYPVGHKFESGDARTPEGRYFISQRLPKSGFYRALQISYPNEHDAARAASRGVNPGGQIMIHGLPNGVSASGVSHPKLDWTQGCIAVTNREMNEIWALVPEGIPIDIYA